MKDFFVPSGLDFQKCEKEKARKIRKSNWWKRVLNQRKCYYCGEGFPVDQMTMDHKVPIIRGGKSVRGNLVPCCKTCNIEKGFMTSVEWFQKKALKK